MEADERPNGVQLIGGDRQVEVCGASEQIWKMMEIMKKEATFTSCAVSVSHNHWPNSIH